MGEVGTTGEAGSSHGPDGEVRHESDSDDEGSQPIQRAVPQEGSSHSSQSEDAKRKEAELRPLSHPVPIVEERRVVA